MRAAGFALGIALLSSSTAVASAQSPVAELGWLGGCWEMQSGSLLIEEQWTAPRAGTILGTSRTSRDGTLVGYEFMRIFARGDTLIFAAAPSGQIPAEFAATTMRTREVQFENPEHDFPQRILYRAVGPDSLRARVEGRTNDGRERGSDFPYARVTCPASPDP